MESDFLVIEQVRKEKNIEKLRSLFIKTLNEHESQLVEINEAHLRQIDLLEQQLSDSNAAANALKDQIKQIREMNDTDIDLVRVNERRLEGLLKATLEQNAELRSQISTDGIGSRSTAKIAEDVLTLQDKNSSLAEQLARCKEEKADLIDALDEVRESLRTLAEENRELRQFTVSFIASTNQSLGIAKKTAKKSIAFANNSNARLQTVIAGLAKLKKQVQGIKQYRPKLIPCNFRAYKVKLWRKITEEMNGQISQHRANFSSREKQTSANTIIAAEHCMDQVTSLKLMMVSTSSSFALFKRFWENQLTQLKDSCAHFAGTFQMKLDAQQQKHHKKLKAKEIEIRKLNEEISLLKTSSEIIRGKMKALKAASPKPKKTGKSMSRSSISHKTAKSTSSTDGLSDMKESNLVSIGTQSGLINMTLIRDRTIRHSKEAELSVVQAELQRTKEKNQKLLEQIGGLRRMVKRAGESANEESGRVRQTIDDLETQLREEKRSVQRKNTQYVKLQKDNEELAHAAAKVEPLKKCLLLLFKNCHDRLEPLIAEQSISDELSELDELSQEIFKVPIHKICRPLFSKGFLKKQERRLANAINDGIEVGEVTKVFDAIMDELQKRSHEAKELPAPKIPESLTLDAESNE